MLVAAQLRTVAHLTFRGGGAAMVVAVVESYMTIGPYEILTRHPFLEWLHGLPTFVS